MARQLAAKALVKLARRRRKRLDALRRERRLSRAAAREGFTEANIRYVAEHYVPPSRP